MHGIPAVLQVHVQPLELWIKQHLYTKVCSIKVNQSVHLITGHANMMAAVRKNQMQCTYNKTSDLVIAIAQPSQYLLHASYCRGVYP